MTKDEAAFSEQLADLVPGAEDPDEDEDLLDSLEKGLITTGRKPAEGKDPMVDHPAHYNQHPAGIECIEVIAPMVLPIGSAIKHLWRAGLKPGVDDVQDVEKAIWYLQYHLEQLKHRAVIVSVAGLTAGSES